MMFVNWETNIANSVASLASYYMYLYADAHSFSCLWENSFKENIGKLCKIRVQSKQRFLQVEQTNVKSPVT